MTEVASTSTSTVKILPYIDIQHDALAVFDDVQQGIVAQEDVWVSAYRAGRPSVHGKMRVSRGEDEVACRGGVEVVRESKANFLVSVPALNIVSLPVRFPKQTLVPPYTKPSAVSPELSINSIAYSPKSAQLVVGGPDGYALVLDPAHPSSVVELKGHVGDVLDVKWFPSGEVVLTASSDMSLRVFSSVTGVNPRILRGHTRAITSTHVLGVGRQVLSAGKDGSVRLWNVGGGKEERSWRVKLPVEAMIVVEDEAGTSALSAEGAVILATTQDGAITAFALDSSSSDPIFATPPSGSKLISAAYSPSLGLMATGHADGTIALRHLSSLRRSPTTDSPPPATVVKRNEAAIYSLFFDGSSLLVGTASGLPARLTLTLSPSSEIGVSVAEEFAGWEAVGVATWAVGDGAWCAGSDGVLRRY